MITITFEADSVQALYADMKRILCGEEPSMKSLLEQERKTETTIEKRNEETVQAIREAVEKTADIVAPAVDVPKEEPKAAAPTKEEARAALNELRTAQGAAAVKNILASHNVKSFLDLTEDLYAVVIEEAKHYAAQ